MTTWTGAIERFHAIHPHRSPKLFTEFLPQGYDMTTLSSVDTSARARALRAKCFLGMYITLYDDLADNPALFNMKLLTELYKIPFHGDEVRADSVDDDAQKYLTFARVLADALLQELSTLTHYDEYRELFEFDLRQFYNCNQYYTLAQKYPHLGNSVEARLFGPFNMGMIVAATIDIMASSTFCTRELGQARALFLFGQRFGHICNSLTTLAREISEQTITNEVLLIAHEKSSASHFSNVIGNVDVALSVLREEQELLLTKLAVHARMITSFDAHGYINGLKNLRALHERMMGSI